MKQRFLKESKSRMMRKLRSSVRRTNNKSRSKQKKLSSISVKFWNLSASELSVMLKSSVLDKNKSSEKIEFEKKEKKLRDFICNSWTQRGKLKPSRGQTKRKLRKWKRSASEEKLKSLIVKNVSSWMKSSVNRESSSKMKLARSVSQMMTLAVLKSLRRSGCTKRE